MSAKLGLTGQKKRNLEIFLHSLTALRTNGSFRVHAYGDFDRPLDRLARALQHHALRGSDHPRGKA